MTAIAHYDYDPDPRFSDPEEFAESVWSAEPELRTYVTPKGISWVAAQFYERYSDFDVNVRESTHHRWGPTMAHRNYSYHHNLFRQLMAALHPEDTDPADGHRLRLSWIQAMDYEFVLIELAKTLRGESEHHTLDFFPLSSLDPDQMPTPDEVDAERERLREECISKYRLVAPTETNPPRPAGGVSDDADEETLAAVEKFKKCRDSSY